MNSPLKLIFYGTPEFAVPSLEMLLKNHFNIQAVVTAPDKAAGRGLKVQSSAVKEFAEKHNLKVLQPLNLNDEMFLDTLKSFSPDLQIVVAFRKMPEKVWNLPKFGTFNLHASLLPQYRGAAPIHRAVMNGEKVTGVTTFFLEKEIDTGKIIFFEKISIYENETTGELHDRLKIIGADLVLKTVREIEHGTIEAIPQNNLETQGELLKTAPKIKKEDCRINWNNSATEVFNLIRGLSPFPCAFTTLLKPNGEKINFKIFRTFPPEKENPDSIVNSILQSDSVSRIKIKCMDGWISLKEVQLEGKKRLNVEEFLRGNRITNEWKVE